jgi:hypothetical protein
MGKGESNKGVDIGSEREKNHGRSVAQQSSSEEGREGKPTGKQLEFGGEGAKWVSGKGKRNWRI